MREILRLRKENDELKKEVLFLKKVVSLWRNTHSSQEKSSRGVSTRLCLYRGQQGRVWSVVAFEATGDLGQFVLQLDQGQGKKSGA